MRLRLRSKVTHSIFKADSQLRPLDLIPDNFNRSNPPKLTMKTKQIIALFSVLFILPFASQSHAAAITATNSGNWGAANIWDSGTVPGINDVVFIAAGVNVTVNTNASAQSISDDTTGGTVTMAPNSALSIFGNDATHGLTTLNTTAAGNTVIYAGNPFFAKQCDYYNLMFANTNYVDPFPPFAPYQNFNNFSSPQGPTPMTVAGNMTLIGAVKVQQGSQGADISIGGNLILGTNCIWDSSGANLTVAGNAVISGLLQDLNGALGSDTFNNVTVNPGATWDVSDVTHWSVGGSLANHGTIKGKGYGSIAFNGTGAITGSPFKIPTLTVNGTTTIGTTITLSTNTPTLNGTLVFDIANPQQIILPAYVGTALYYSGNLSVINSGAPPASGATYQLFNAPSYGGSFSATSFPSLPSGLSWVDDTLTTGSISVTGTAAGSPVLTISRTGGLLTLSWDSATFPGYRVQAQTNNAGIGPNWGATGSGTVSPFSIPINPANPPVFFRLVNP